MITDLSMPGMNGYQLCWLIRGISSVPVLMMSGHGTVETAVTALQDGAYDFIEKPFRADRLIGLVERAIEADRLRRENEELRLRADTANELIGGSQMIRDIKQSIDRVAKTNSRVLITGPAGSGKEVVARMLHAQSRRAEGPFVVVNCATMSPERFEMELFGAENPDADGERPQRVGTFEAAHNGTMFLDEVADMPLETQGKIVRVLQEQIFERVGGTTRVEVDVRVVASSTSNLADKISAGYFREDLFYRLNVVPLEVPPLNKRPEDIPALAEHFMERAALAAGQTPRGIGADALAGLQAYSWPGNVRELRNVIERAVLLTHHDLIAADDLTLCNLATASESGEFQFSFTNYEPATLADMEKRHIAATLGSTGWNKSRAAEILSIERSTLDRKIKRYKLKPKE